jgi:hypothetical protein
MPNIQYYQLDVVDAAALKSMVAVSTDSRRQAIGSYLDKHGIAATLNLFVQSLGMANSVVQNCRIAAELFVSENADVHPYIAAQINLPTMMGACMGASLSAKCHPLPSGACHGCAYRLGSIANQSESATDDAAYALVDRKGFMCHAELDNEGEPARVCAGHAKAHYWMDN